MYIQFTGKTWIFKCVPDQIKSFISRWSNLQKRCTMSWNEWKTKTQIFWFFFFELSWKCIENWPYFDYKNGHSSKNKNRKNLKLGFSFYSANCGRSFFISKVVKFTWKNHNRLSKKEKLSLRFLRFLFFQLWLF